MEQFKIATDAQVASTKGLTTRIREALASVFAGLKYEEYAPALAAYLVEAARTEADATPTRAVLSPAERGDYAWTVVLDSHRGGTSWSTSLPVTCGRAGRGHVQVVEMRRVARRLEAAGITPSRVWLVDKRTAADLTAANLTAADLGGAANV